jgi:hypothetical protein
MSIAFDLASYNHVRANARQNPREALGWVDALRRPLAGGARRTLSQLGVRRLSGLKEEVITVDPVGRVCCNTKPRVHNSNDAIPTRSEYGLLSWARVCTSALKNSSTARATTGTCTATKTMLAMPGTNHSHRCRATRLNLFHQHHTARPDPRTCRIARPRGQDAASAEVRSMLTWM